MLSLTRTTSSRRSDPMVLGTVKLKHRKSILWPTTRRRDVSKRIMKKFTIICNETKSFVIRSSKLAGPRRSASQWINWHRKTTPIAYPEMNSRDIKAIGIHNNEPSPPRIRRRTCRTNSFSTVPKMAPVFFQWFLVELGHVQKLVELMSSIPFQRLFFAVGFAYSW